MTRFSPTIRPSGAPSGLGSLAQALQSGIAGYRDTQDRAEAQRDRERQRVIQTDTLASQGMTPQFADAPESFGSALSRAMSGQPAPAPRRAVAPGAFKPWDGDFEKPDPMTGRPQEQALPTMRLPSGGTYDPNVALQREGASLTQKGAIETGTLMNRDAQMFGVQRERNAEALRGIGMEGAKASAIGIDTPATRTYLAKEQPRNIDPWSPDGIAAKLRLAASQPAKPGSSLASVTSMRTGALYTTAKYGYDTLEAIMGGDDPATPEVETGRAKVVPNWLEQQGAKVGIGAGNYLTTDQMRQIRASGNILSDSWLRFTSGAAVPETEVERFAQGFLPVAGDDDGTLRVKAGARQVIINAMRDAAGRGLEPGAMDEALTAQVLGAIGRIDPEAAAIGRRYMRGTVMSTPGQPQTQAPPASDLVGEFESRFPTRKP